MCDVNLYSGSYLLNYTHIPTIILMLSLGGLILFSDIKNKINIVYFFTIISLIVWVLSNYVSWNESNPIYILWAERVASVGILSVALVSLFTYIFPEGKKISLKIVFAIFSPLLPFFVLVPTELYVKGIKPAPSCETITGPLFYFVLIFTFYYILLSSWFLFKKYKKVNDANRNQLKIFILGMILTSLFGTIFNIIPTILGLGDTLTIFTPLAGLVFSAFCGFAIVKYKFLNIKLIAAQVLTYSIWVLIASQLFFVKTTINFVLTGVTLALSILFGIMLIKSVKSEVKRKEELQYLTEKLAIANDELRKLDNAKSEFISIASHQLRTPLTSIKGYISLLLEGNYGKIDEVIMDPISKIYASNERLIQLVEELLNVSRIESGRMEYIFEKSSIEKITTALKDTFSVIAKGKGLYMHLNMPSEPLPEIEIDAGKTREVISNLIDNALKYTRRGGITVKAELLKDMNWSVKHAGGQDEDLSGDIVRITISDTGIGVPETELPYLFSKFSRGKDTSRLHVSGTGLGLYVGRNIIEAQHGKIWVESEGLNKGSKFIIDLPVVQPKK